MAHTKSAVKRLGTSKKANLRNRARISEDNGTTWSEDMVLSDDSPSWDMGYPSTARLDDGTFFTLWYENIRGTARLRGLNWQLDR